jgi:glycosyltransferase involved in cell wall biosynthesis
MKILFIHQNFPGQFKHLAPYLVAQGHQVDALHMQASLLKEHFGVTTHCYGVTRASSKVIHPWVADFETKVIRGEACFLKMKELSRAGYVPDVIFSHHGWGETLFLREVWPNTPLIIYCEFHYEPRGLDVNFDPEFSNHDDGEPCRVSMKNINNYLHFRIAQAGMSPTYWQASTFPLPFREQIKVIHDGIDTQALIPDETTEIAINHKIKLRRSDEVITFVNRNLEPYRGFHIFLRSLPAILRQRPTARAILIGGNGVSYGAPPKDAKSWREHFVNEVRPQMSDEEWSRVHFVGSVPYEQFLAIMRISSAHVYLTYPFVLSWSLLEAMSMQCPIVGSNTGPLREVIEDGHNGFLVDFFDQVALTEKIIELLKNKALGKKLGVRGRKLVVENYDLKRVCLPAQRDFIQGIALG